MRAPPRSGGVLVTQEVLLEPWVPIQYYIV